MPLACGLLDVALADVCTTEVLLIAVETAPWDAADCDCTGDLDAWDDVSINGSASLLFDSGSPDERLGNVSSGSAEDFCEGGREA